MQLRSRIPGGRVHGIERDRLRSLWKLDLSWPSNSADSQLQQRSALPGSLNQINLTGFTNQTVRNFLTPGDPTFNQPDLVFPNNARAMQFWRNSASELHRDEESLGSPLS